MQSALDVEEPSILIGSLLRETFKRYLKNAGVKVVCNFKVQKLIRWKDTKIIVMGNSYFEAFDYAVNTTSYQALLPPPEPSLPFDLNIVYQPCLALVYEDRLSKILSQPPFSFIVVDGWFPCIMPYIGDREEAGSGYRKYIVTHGKYTIMGSYKTVEEASKCLVKIDEKFITTHVQPKCETEMERFWPVFGACMPGSSERRFKYVGLKGSVLAKIQTNGEFRCGLTIAIGGVVYIIPGKVSNIFDAGRETISLINNENVLHKGAYRYVKGGTLDDAVGEITEAIDPNIKNTCTLQTYAEITGHLNGEKKATPPESKKCLASKLEQSIQWVTHKNLDNPSGLEKSNLVSFFQPPPKTLKTGSTIKKTSNCKTQIRSSL